MEPTGIYLVHLATSDGPGHCKWLLCICALGMLNAFRDRRVKNSYPRFPSSPLQCRTRQELGVYPTSFLNILGRRWSKYLRPGFKPCDEAARRFFWGYYVVFLFGSCTRVIDKFLKSEYISCI
jgi:hypothetical protein